MTRILLSAVALSLPVSAYASASVDLFSLSLDELMHVEVYTASQERESAAESPAIISVITARQLKDWGVLSLNDALSFLPGIVKSETYLAQTTQTFRGVTPGLFNNKSLFMINGHPIYESLFGSTQLEYLPLEMVERIEVVRSPASVLYGTSAISGVVNVITRQSDGQRNEIAVRAGSHDHGYASIRHHGAGYSIGASVQRDGGYAYNGTLDEFGNPVDMDYRNDIENLFVDVNGTDWRINAAIFKQEKARYGINPWVWQNGINEQYAGYLDANKRFSVAGGELNLWLRYDLADKNLHAGEFPFPSSLADCAAYGIPAGLCAGANPTARDAYSTVTNTVERYSMELQYKVQVNEELSYILGISAEHSESEPLTFQYDSDGSNNPNGGAFEDSQRADTQALYGQLKYRINADTLAIAGVRGEYNSDAGMSDLVPRLGITYQVVDNTYLKAMYSEAFRTPVFIEKHVLLENVLYGNEDLRRETIKTYELGVDSQLDTRNNLQAAVYWLTLEDEIIRQQVADPNSTATEYVNAPGREMYGLEIEWKSILTDRFEMTLNGSFTDGKDKTLATGDTPFVANVAANAIFTYHLSPQWKATLSSQYVGSKDYLLVDDRTGSIGSYTVSNLVFAYQYKDIHEVDIACLNVLDEDYQYPEPVRRVTSGLPGGPGASVYLTYRYRFQ